MQEKQLKVLLVEDNPGDARLVQEMLADAEGSLFQVHCADTLLAALDALANRTFDVALVDLSLPDSHGLECFTTIQAHAPGMPVVVLTGLDSESMAVDAMQSGVQDYLIKGKLSTESLARALHYAVVRHSKSAEQTTVDPEKAVCIGFLSSKGGVGTTTIASHFAVDLKRQTGQKVLLVDLDVTSTSAGFLLGATSPHTIHEVATNLHRLDLQFWSGVVSNTTKGVDFLRSPGSAQHGDQLSGERVRHVLRFARSLYRWIVIDLGRLDAVAIHLLQEMRDLFVISTDEVPSLYEANRVLKRLIDLGFKRDYVRLVLNRVPKSAVGSLTDLEKAMGYLFYGVVSDHSKELQEAHASGRALHEGLNIHRDVAKLVGKTLGIEVKQPAPTGLNLFRFGRSQPQPQ
jgi:Flp pilus assembly CpaE family ATPase